MKNCPNCDYDLRGSQAEGRCPECGIPAGPDVVAVKIEALLSELVGPGGVALVLLFLWSGVRIGGYQEDDVRIVVVPTCALIAYVVIVLFRNLGRRNLVLLSNAGMDFTYSRFKLGLVSWDVLASASIDHLQRNLVLHGTNSSILLRCSVRRFGGLGAATRLVGIVKRCRERAESWRDSLPVANPIER